MPLPPHPHPPQSRRRMIIRQLQLSLPPHPLLLNMEPLEQQDNKRMIQIMELHPHSFSWHPQFVAAKSLISDLQKIFIYSIGYVTSSIWFHLFSKRRLQTFPIPVIYVSKPMYASSQYSDCTARNLEINDSLVWLS